MMPDLLLIGRQQETEQIGRLLRSGQSISVVGPRGVGKTTLLRHVTSAAILNPQQAPSERLIPIWFDNETLSRVGVLDFYSRLIQQFHQVAAEVSALFPTEVISFRDIRQWARQVQRSGVQLVIVLDDFERLAQNPLLDTEFFGSLRSLVTGFDMTYLTASRAPLSNLTYADSRMIGSPFFNIFHKVTLRPLSRAESRQMMYQLAVQAEVVLPDEIVTFVCALAEGRPGYLALAAQLVLRRWQDNNGAWQKTDYELAEREFLEKLPKE